MMNLMNKYFIISPKISLTSLYVNFQPTMFTFLINPSPSLAFFRIPYLHFLLCCKFSIPQIIKPRHTKILQQYKYHAQTPEFHTTVFIHLLLSRYQIMTINFPPEITREILSYLSPPFLRRLLCSHKCGPVVDRIIESLLYQRLSYSHKWSSTLHNVSARELFKLARGEIRCNVRYLEICVREAEDLQHIEKFRELVTKHRDFLLRIPEIKLTCSENDYKYFKSLEPKLKDVSLAFSYPRRMDFPSKAESLAIDYRNNCGIFSNPEVSKWPENLKHLQIDNAQVARIDLPETIETLKCQGNLGCWIVFPTTLKKIDFASLAISWLRLCDMPRTLSELSLRDCSLRHIDYLQYLPELKKLDLSNNHIRSLRGARFPPNLEVLNLLGNKLTKIQSYELPDSLTELNLARNRIRKLCKLPPKLEVLDVSVLETEFPAFIEIESSSVWPENLRVLKASGQERLQWRHQRTYKSLTHLEISCERTRLVKFPPNLKVLHVAYSRYEELTKLKLPPQLTDLKISGGYIHQIKWATPLLKNLSVSHFDFPVAIPDSVERLEYMPRDADERQRPLFSKQEFPRALEEMTTTFPFERFPDSIARLKLVGFFLHCVKAPKNLVSLELDTDCIDINVSKKHSRFEFFAAGCEYHELPDSVRWFTRIRSNFY